MEVSIVLNGTPPSRVWLKRTIIGTVIAADGGADVCRKYGIVPAYIIGDMDSVSPNTLTHFRTQSKVICAPSQNSTDFQKALVLARKIGAKQIYVFGGFGGDYDHEHANVLTLGTDCSMLDERHEINVVEKNFKISGRPGAFVSVIALSDVTGLSFSGLKWRAPRGKISAGWIGIRNQLTKQEAVIRVQKGTIAVIRITA